MRLHRAPARRRGGFTLIEMLVVILIIAVLVSLLGSAVFQAYVKMDEVKTRHEITQLASGIKQFESDTSLTVPPPSRIALHPTLAGYGSSQLDVESLAFLRKAWPRVFAGGAINWGPNNTAFDGVLEGEECLVFFVGGMQVQNNGQWTCVGFSTDSTNPMNPNVATRKGPYYQFDSTRLKILPGRTFLSYFDPYSSASGGQPYVYFSSGTGQNKYDAYFNALGVHDCSSLTPMAPYFNGNQYYNPDTFQIISAGRDQTFGVGGQWKSSDGTSGPATVGGGADNITNFYDAKLGATP